MLHLMLHSLQPSHGAVNSLKARFAIEAHLSSLFSEEGEAQQQSTAFDEVGDGEVPDDLANRADGHQTNQVQGVSEPRPPLELPADVSPSLKEELAQEQS